MKKILVLMGFFMLTAAPAMAADTEGAPQTQPEEANGKADIASTYSPDYCEFTVTFPGEPYMRQQCEGEGGAEKCFDQVSYTQVYDLSSTVNFRVICSRITEDVRKNYSGEIMQATLERMTENSVVKKFETNFREEENYKQASLVGEGKVGRLPTIYIAQLWIGDGSAFSVEAELIGSQSHDADKLFSEVLRSIRYKGDEPETTEKNPEDTKAESKEEPAQEQED